MARSPTQGLEVTLLKGQRGREFNVASICVSKIVSSSPVNCCLPTEQRSNDFVYFTPTSHKPPKCGDEGGLKYQLMYLVARQLCSRLWNADDWVSYVNGVNSFEAPTKFVPQSLCISFIGPRRAEKRTNANRKVSVDKVELNFKWYAFVVVQTNRCMYSSIGALRRPQEPFSDIGPAQSTPVLVNGLSCCTRYDGRLAIFGCTFCGTWDILS